MSLGTIHAVQIDLARQIETVPTVCRFFDLAAASGYNTVVLYLEDRIRTPSYPWAEDAESYSAAQITQMVAYADTLSLELIPVVSNLGHTERFLRHPQLQHLAERRGGIAGRFAPEGSTNYNEVCPSLEETYVFFDRYITEVAALFPSKYFHVGLDEIFDMGYCPLCRAVMRRGGLSAIFSAHIRRTHALLTSLGKTMIMWDDMFEECPESLNDLPRDVVLCAWHYDYVDRRPAGHFDNGRRDDSFALYESMGISYLASTHSEPSNVSSFTRYAAQHKPMGMFLTLWEKSREQLLYLYPLIAQAGLLWQGIDADAPFERMVKAVKLAWPESDDGFAQAAAAALTLPSWSMGVRGLPESVELPNQQAELLEYQRRNLLAQLAPCGGDAAAAVRCRLELPLLCGSLHKLAYDLWEYRTGERSCDLTAWNAALDAAEAGFRALYEVQRGLWKSCRGGLASPDLDSQYESFFREIAALREDAGTARPGDRGRLDVTFCLPDQHGAPKLRILMYTISGECREIAVGSFKAADLQQAFFTRSFAIDADTIPAAVTLAVSGYGSTGVCFADAVTAHGRFIPYGVSQQSGQVSDPAAVLTDDTRPAWLGEPEVQRGFLYPELPGQEAALTIQMNKTID